VLVTAGAGAAWGVVFVVVVCVVVVFFVVGVVVCVGAVFFVVVVCFGAVFVVVGLCFTVAPTALIAPTVPSAAAPLASTATNRELITIEKASSTERRLNAG